MSQCLNNLTEWNLAAFCSNQTLVVAIYLLSNLPEPSQTNVFINSA